MKLRVLAWNVWGFRRGVEVVADVVRGVVPDVLLLQETGPRPKLSAFAQELDLRVSADPAVGPWHRRVRNAVCVRKPWAIEAAQHVRFSGGSWRYPRGAAVGDLGLGPARLRAISTHLGFRAGERGTHAADPLRLVDVFDGPSVLGGDLNARPHQDAAMIVGERLHDVWEPAIGAGRTYPTDDPEARIDYVFVTGQLSVLDAEVIETTASDHLPVMADLELFAG